MKGKGIVITLWFASLAIAAWLGTGKHESGFPFLSSGNDTYSRSNAADSHQGIEPDEGCAEGSTRSTRGSLLEALALETDSLARIRQLLDILDRSSAEEISKLYNSFPLLSEQERMLVIAAWLQKGDAGAILSQIKETRPGELAQAYRLAKLEPEASMIAWQWATSNEPQLALGSYGEQIDSGWFIALPEVGEPVEVTITESRIEMPVFVTQQSWLTDFPTGLSVESTAQRIAEKAVTDNERARNWIRHTSDRKSALRAASAVGAGAASQMSQGDFSDWLTALDPEMASLAAAGYLDAVAATNPELALAFAESYGNQVNLDLALYFVAQRLLINPAENQIILETFIQHIGDFTLRGEIASQVSAQLALLNEAASGSTGATLAVSAPPLSYNADGTDYLQMREEGSRARDRMEDYLRLLENRLPE